MADESQKKEPSKPGEARRTLHDILSEKPDVPYREQLRRAAQRAALRKALEESGVPASEGTKRLDINEAAIRRLAELQREAEEKREQELLDAAVKWLENKWGELPCPYCRHIEWQVGTPLEITLNSDEVMSPAFPVMCGNCGHTTFVNAIRAGLLPEVDEEA